MKLSCKDERFKGKKLVMLDRSTFQSLTTDQLDQMCTQYAILCTPNFLYECIRKKNLEERLLNIETESFVMICESPKRLHILHRYDLVKRDLLSLDDYLVTIFCVNRDLRKSIFPDISKDSDSFYKRADSELQYLNELFDNFKDRFVDLIGGNKTVARKALKESKKVLGYRLLSLKIDDICQSALSCIPPPEGLIRTFHLPINSKGTRLIDEKELNWALDRLSLYNDRPIETIFLKYSRYYFFLDVCRATYKAFKGEYLNDSYVRDWEYLYFLPFCDLFVSNDNFFEQFVPSLPQPFEELNDKFVSINEFCKMNGWQNVKTEKNVKGGKESEN